MKINYIEAILPTSKPEEAQPLPCFYRVESDVSNEGKAISNAIEIATKAGIKDYKIQRHVHNHPDGACQIEQIKEIKNGVDSETGEPIEGYAPEDKAPDTKLFAFKEEAKGQCLFCQEEQEAVAVLYDQGATQIAGLKGDLVICQTCLSKMFKMLGKEG